MAEHNETGKAGEKMAAEFLQAKGYAILAYNWRHNKAEIDLIARIGNDIVFVEVKTRSSDYFGFPEESVSKTKQLLLQKAADAYLEQQRLTEEDLRFDIIAIVKEKQGNSIYHIEDAFWPGEL